MLNFITTAPIYDTWYLGNLLSVGIYTLLGKAEFFIVQYDVYNPYEYTILEKVVVFSNKIILTVF